MTIEDVKVIIQGDETRTLEMKKTTGELKDGMRSACAFLNTAGGWLFCVGHIQTRNPTTPQVNTPSTPSTPSTSKREIAKAKRLKALLSAIGANGSNLRALMESMQRKDRKGFVSTYIVPNIEAGYIAMLYPEAPNHPMQSYYLTKKGRELLEHL